MVFPRSRVSFAAELSCTTFRRRSKRSFTSFSGTCSKLAAGVPVRLL